MQSYYRYRVPDRSFHAWDQFRDENGNPVTPQRANVMGYTLNGTGYRGVRTGIHGDCYDRRRVI
ncbi:hypothetical protein [Lachnoclostridium sp. Marseille-P6806]|uniref:hypothetical protein n=1 Tax=Lachnoclostridium sp. Marseille-P6806 TaxID=2364793 RepID=UPI00103065EC|nr:hypothetical protein [Lachnoclostridium sp. Marseille-P6806]